MDVIWISVCLRACTQLFLFLQDYVHVVVFFLVFACMFYCLHDRFACAQECCAAAFLSITQPLHQGVMVGGQASFNQGKNSISH